MLPDAPSSLKEWIFILGVILILLALWPDTSSATGRRKASNLPAVYGLVLADWLCVVNFFDFRQSLELAGLSAVWSWVLAPPGLIIIVGLSVALLEMSETPAARYVAVAALWLALLASYSTIVAGGLDAWFVDPE